MACDLETDPPGLQVTLDGKAERAPLVVTGVTGITRERTVDGAGGGRGERTAHLLRVQRRARLWVNGTLLVDGWAEHAARVAQGTINLVAGQRYAVRLEYHDLAGEAGVRLLWSAPGLPRQILPASQLFP